MQIETTSDQEVANLDIVLLEENKATQSLVRSMLTAFRVRRVRAYDRAEQALKEMMTDPPNMVLTDWELRPLSGEKFVRLLRSKSFEPLCFVPVIMITANATLRVIDRAFSAGVNHLLVKPLSPSILHRRLQLAIREDNGFELDGDHYVLSGIQEVLDERVRRDDVTEMIRRAEAMQAVLGSQQSRAQLMVDEILDSDETTAPDPASEKALAANWRGWRV